ncbi:MAG: hypothetical protein WAO52_08130 [Prolixibacteraceae bacterium]
MKKNKSNAPAPLPKGRKTAFSIIAISLPFVLLVLLEIVLRISGYGDNHSLFIQHPDREFQKYLVVNPEIGKKYFSNMPYSEPAKDLFLKEKPADIFRIFVMGSSTVVGFPYDNNLMFSRILQERLRDAYPDKKIELVNTAITAINSFTLADFMPQILKQKPDAILFYAGHNEFYGAFGIGSNEAFVYNPLFIRLHLKLLDFRIYQLTINTIGHISGLFKDLSSKEDRKGTLMSKVVKDANIYYGSKTYKTGIENYERNLRSMLEMAKANQVPVFISDLVSNLRDLKPFKSESTADLKGADEYYITAVKFDQQGQFDKAHENYILARDYDCVRFRASSDINTIIQELADRYQVHYVPTLKLFNSNSPNGIPGNNLLTEHVHPNISGEFLLSESFYQAITQSKLISGEINTQTEKSLKNFIKDYGYSELDYLIGKHRITNLKYHWPFIDDSQNYIDYRQIYKPSGRVDSLAFNVMAKQSMTLKDAHEQLAEMYEKKGDFMNAFKEYNSLTEISPYLGVYFRRAADCLLKMNDLPEAQHYYERSTEYIDSSFYAHYRAGEICMFKNDFEKAVVHFQKAQTAADKQEKEKALLKIYQALIYLKQEKDGQEIAAYFRKNYPNRQIPLTPRSFTYLNYIPDQIREKVDEARKLAEIQQYGKSIQLLEETLETKDSPVVYRLLGEFCFRNKDYEKARQYQAKAFPEFKFEVQFLEYCFLTNLAANKPEEAKKVLEQLKKTDQGYTGISRLQEILNQFNPVNPTAQIEKM